MYSIEMSINDKEMQLIMIMTIFKNITFVIIKHVILRDCRLLD